MIVDVLLMVSFIALLVLGTRMFVDAGGSRAARHFGLYCFAGAVITLTEIMAHLAPSEDVARIWAQFGAIWPLAWVFFAHFAVESSGVPSDRRLAVVLTYAAAITIGVSYLVLAGRGSVVVPASDYGFALESAFVSEPLGLVIAICHTAIVVFTLVVLLIGAQSGSARSRRRQVLWILTAYGLGFLVGVGLVLLRELGGLPVREVNGVSYLVTAVVVYLGIARKHMVHLTPQLAARQALDRIDECFLLTDEQYRIVTVNAAAARTFRTERSNLVGADIRDIFGWHTDRPTAGDVVIHEDTESATTLNISETRSLDHLGDVVARVFVGRDITKERADEKRLRELLAEKDAVVRELHHRVRNTLQLIDGLVTLKASRLQSPEAVEVFHDVIDRIRTVGQIHGDIYSEGDFNAIPLDRAIRDQCDQQLGSAIDRSCLTMEFELDSVLVSVEMAVPLLLAVAELVSNAIRHAYRDSGSGTIRVRSLSLPADEWRIIVADDGPGVPDVFPVGAVGIDLARELARQAGGELECDCARGTRWTLTFPVRV